jgi:hypothetical protein
MEYQSSQTPAFLKTVKEWIAETGEVLVLIRYSYAAGNRSYEFFSSFSLFQERIAQCEPRTCFVVFRKPQLTLRGVVDDDFITKAMSIVPDGDEYLIAGLDEVHYGRMSWLPNHSGESHLEMREDLEDAKGTRVAFGPYPPWLKDTDDVISAIVPLPDGKVECGVY